MTERFWGKVEVRGPTECWPWMAGKDDDGYGSFWIIPQNRGAHRVAFELHWGVSLPSWLCVCHECDNRPCCNPGHLWIGTNADNQVDCKVKGRRATGDRNGSRLHPESRPHGDLNGARSHPKTRPRGVRHKQARLTELQVFGIMARLLMGAEQRQVAKEFGTARSHVHRIWSGKAWKHLFQEPGA